MNLGPGKLHDAIRDLERRMMVAALFEFNFKISAAARDLGISRVSFYSKLEELKIDAKGSINAGEKISMSDETLEQLKSEILCVVGLVAQKNSELADLQSLKDHWASVAAAREQLLIEAAREQARLNGRIARLESQIQTEKSREIAEAANPGQTAESGTERTKHRWKRIRQGGNPAMMGKLPSLLRPLLVIDTASKTGATIRKIAKRFEAEYQIVLFEEPPLRRFWYEQKEGDHHVDR